MKTIKNTRQECPHKSNLFKCAINPSIKFFKELFSPKGYILINSSPFITHI